DLVFAQIFFREQQHFLDQAGNVGQLPLHGLVAGETQHAVDDGGGALASFKDLLQGLGAGGVVLGGPQTELAVVDDRRQDVVEFVGHAGGQRPDRAQPLRVQ